MCVCVSMFVCVRVCPCKSKLFFPTSFTTGFFFLVCVKAVKGRLFVWEAFTTYFSSEAGGPLASSIIISRNQKALLRPNNNVISGNFISMSCHFSLNLVTPFTIFYKSLYFVSPYNINTLNSECVCVCECVYMCVCIYVVSVCMRVCVC